ncbi:MAG: DUF4350 domain-containing protein [bacterium]
MKRYHKFLINSIIMTVAVIGVAGAIYYIISRHHYRFDLTQANKFSLSLQTIKTLRGLDRDVEITAFFSDVDPFKETAKDMLEEYSYRSGKIKYRFVDPEKNPGEAKKYGVKGLRAVVFQSEGSRKDVQESEMMSYTMYNPYEQRPPEFKGEEAFTNAIVAVTQRERRLVCFIEGHGERRITDIEREGFSEVRDALDKENYNIQSVELIKEHQLPASCYVLIIAAPEKPLFEKEIQEIDRFLEGGGKAVVMSDPVTTPGLEKLLDRWGVSVGDDVVVDRGSMFFFGPLTPIPRYGVHTITEELEKQNVGTIFPGVRTVSEKKGGVRKGVEVSVLLRSSEESWAEKNLEDPSVKYDEGEDIKGPVTMAVAVSVEKKGGETRLVVVGDSDFVSNSAINEGANRDLFLNMVNWIAGEEKKISIRPRSVEEEKVMLSGAQAQRIFYITVLILPAAVLIFGGGIWMRRRNR